VKNAKIVLVAAWDGWCGSCAVERPLVLTRSGRLGLRTWLTAPVDDVLPLTLTCRLCGSSTLVPAEVDDPPVLLEPEEEPADDVVPSLLEHLVPVPADVAPGAPAAGLAAPGLAVPGPAAPVGVPPVLAGAAAPTPLAAPAVLPPAAVSPEAELVQARGALGAALAALVAQRAALAERVTLIPSVLPSVPAVAPPVLPLQRTAPADEDGLATLQLLADGLDLLSSTRG
jgi:hypothetical protein